MSSRVPMLPEPSRNPAEDDLAELIAPCVPIGVETRIGTRRSIFHAVAASDALARCLSRFSLESITERSVATVLASRDTGMTQLLLFNLFNGLIVGAFYALMALGLSLILNLSGVINFAHGGFLALGAYIAYSLNPYVGFWGGLLIAPFATAAVGLVVERVLIRPLYGRDPLYSLLLTFGLAYIFEDVLRLIWGAQSVPYPIPPELSSPLSAEFFFLTGYRLFMVGWSPPRSSPYS